MTQASLPPTKILGVDFDSTITTGYAPSGFPEVKGLREGMKEKIAAYRAEGWEIVLWTCRDGAVLMHALKWLADQGMLALFDAVNEQAPSIFVRASKLGMSRKLYCDRLVDDTAGNVEQFLRDPVGRTEEA